MSDRPEHDIVPIFPLPGTVFFPQTDLPLHLFEPRYRQMAEDAERWEQRIAVVLLCGDWQKRYRGSPDFEPIGTVGAVESLTRLPDGCFDLKLRGLYRARLEEIPSEHAYRVARAVPLPERPLAWDAAERESRAVDLLATHGYLLAELSDAAPPMVLDRSMSIERAINHVAAHLPIAPEHRQRLLDDDAYASRYEEASRLGGELLRQVLALKDAAGSADSRLIN